MQITLARHGRPVLDTRTLIPGNGLAAWLDVERDAPLDATSRPSADLTRLARDARLLIVSPLRRSRDSAQLLRAETAPTVEEDLREAPLPSAFRSSIRLPPALWAGIARSAWFSGWSPAVEGFSETRRRAKRAAERLHALASEYGDIVVIGHGLMNVLVADGLRGLGWRGPRLPSRAHWGFRSFLH
jgi:broad specificity phosphatase PhoE